MRLPARCLVFAGNARYGASEAHSCMSTGELMCNICNMYTQSIYSLELRKLLLAIQSTFSGVAVA